MSFLPGFICFLCFGYHRVVWTSHNTPPIETILILSYPNPTPPGTVGYDYLRIRPLTIEGYTDLLRIWSSYPIQVISFITQSISSSFLTDANIDASCNRTHYGSNWVVCLGKSILTIYNWLLTMTNTRITPWVTVQGKGSARTAPRLWFPTLLNKLPAGITRVLPLLPTVVRYQRWFFPAD